MKKSILMSFAMLAFAGAVFAENNRAIFRSPSDVPSQLKVTVLDTQSFDLRLPACFGCGESWKVLGQSDDFAKSETEQLPNGAVEVLDWVALTIPVKDGGNQTQILHFPRLAVGKYQYQVQYGRPFDKNELKPSVLLNVTVKKHGE